MNCFCAWNTRTDTDFSKINSVCLISSTRVDCDASFCSYALRLNLHFVFFSILFFFIAQLRSRVYRISLNSRIFLIAHHLHHHHGVRQCTKPPNEHMTLAVGHCVPYAHRRTHARTHRRRQPKTSVDTQVVLRRKLHRHCNRQASNAQSGPKNTTQQLPLPWPHRWWSHFFVNSTSCSRTNKLKLRYFFFCVFFFHAQLVMRKASARSWYNHRGKRHCVGHISIQSHSVSRNWKLCVSFV